MLVDDNTEVSRSHSRHNAYMSLIGQNACQRAERLDGVKKLVWLFMLTYYAAKD
jgi:hypothetical protein